MIGWNSFLSFIRWENGLNKRQKRVKDGRKEIKNERNKDESLKNKKWIESLGFENLSVEERRTDGERMKNGEERTKTFTDLLMETSRKRYGNTSA